jgi:hypothetical protein
MYRRPSSEVSFVHMAATWAGLGGTHLKESCFDALVSGVVNRPVSAALTSGIHITRVEGFNSHLKA